MGYYPGCAVKSFTPHIVGRVEELLGRLGLEVFEIRDWVCCTGGVAEEAKKDSIERISVLNALLAKKQGAEILATSCSMCLSTLYRGLRRAPASLVESIASKLSVEPSPLPRVVHIADVLLEHASRLELDVSGRVALYPGCGYLVAHGAREARKRIKRLAKLAGLKNYGIVVGCCGFTIYAARPREASVVAKRLEEKMGDADMVVTLCPLCKLTLARFTGLKTVLLEEVVTSVSPR
ncbi:protein of unknown function DUF224 cysteine-rich region domain protein [Pyrolobus fumarii 1A]|uniref:Cysteine-rich domain-containing protein n=1 Tax=Pyrolobus fumarii (strain DSM 11204 / 1A) TaxID=694429 RepID=G0EGB3_PYRF1|nr:protein of unknown function DUF224 cysteine-rich region domain protein [Pyrolobus fumarii 1A]